MICLPQRQKKDEPEPNNIQGHVSSRKNEILNKKSIGIMDYVYRLCRTQCALAIFTNKR